jgi:hypothetical protein
MADLAGLGAAVAAFADALSALSVRVAALEAVLGLARAARALPPPKPPAQPGGGPAGDADVARLQTVLAAFADARGSLAGRVAVLEDAVGAFAPALRRAPAAPLTGAGVAAGGNSRAELDRLQKRTIAFAGVLAGLEQRVAALEDRLDAFFGTGC